MLAATIVAILVTTAALWAVSVYNRLMDLSDEAFDAWDRMTANLKKRHDLVTELIDEVRDVGGFETELLQRTALLIDAGRTSLQNARPSDGVRRVTRSQVTISEMLARIKVNLGRFPDWHPRQRIHALLDDVSAIEHVTADSIRAYNDAAQALNTQTGEPGWALVATLAGVPNAEYWADLEHTSSGPAPALMEHSITPDT